MSPLLLILIKEVGVPLVTAAMGYWLKHHRQKDMDKKKAKTPIHDGTKITDRNFYDDTKITEQDWNGKSIK
uniref:Uncharacterized protein n=1 Tax=viral metagenome TaxID=1070528 RepID=A0A6M3J178_9ZZZZ